MPYGYVKDPENLKHWLVDPEAAAIVKRIFSMCMEGRGPTQIANQLWVDKVLTPTAYKLSHGLSTNSPAPEDPYRWDKRAVSSILERLEYTGCTVNFKTYTNSIWDKKRHLNPVEIRLSSRIHMSALLTMMCLKRFGRFVASVTA